MVLSCGDTNFHLMAVAVKIYSFLRTSCSINIKKIKVRREHYNILKQYTTRALT